jgi:glucose-6-phosphate 1-epimerase
MFEAMSIPTGVTRALHPSGLERLTIATDACRAELFLQGATLTRWAPKGAREVLFTSPASAYAAGKAIRGGVPLCWPWFGPRDGAPQHGFARTALWRLERASLDDDTVVLDLALDGDGHTPAFPHPFALRYRVELGAELACSLTVRSTGDAPFTYEDALHAYFAIRDVREVRVRGLEARPYLDRAGGGSTARTSEPTPFGLAAETDRLYLDAPGPIEVLDDDRSITVTKEGARTTVVWNPWLEKARAMADLGAEAWTGMLCVEPANARSDAVTLAPGAAHTTTMRVRVRGA